MGKRVVEVTHEESRTVTEEVEMTVCDDCGREVGNAGRRYFGFSVAESDESGPEEGAVMTNTVVLCGDCDKRFR